MLLNTISPSRDIHYIDFPLIKETTNNSDLKVYKDSDAIANAFKIWLTGKVGEKVRSTSGGYLIPFLGKPLTDETANKIRTRIIDGLQKDFAPAITVQDLQVIPDVNRNRWLITLTGYNTAYNLGINTFLVVNNRGIV